MIDGERQIGRCRLPDRLAVIDGLDGGEFGEMRLHAIGNLEENGGTVGRRGLAPRWRCGVGGVECGFDILRGRARDFTNHFTADGRKVVEVAPLRWRHPSAPDKVVITVANIDAPAHAFQRG